jgi:hypothetical protein
MHILTSPLAFYLGSATRCDAYDTTTRALLHEGWGDNGGIVGGRTAYDGGFAGCVVAVLNLHRHKCVIHAAFEVPAAVPMCCPPLQTAVG